MLPTRVPRLCCITDGRADPDFLLRLVPALLDGGVDAVQVREPGLPDAVLATLLAALRPRCEVHGAALLVNARHDLVGDGLAHGLQCNARSLAPAVARQRLGAGAVLGFSAHGAADLRLAATAGCDFALLAPVLPTSSKPGAAPLGAAVAGALTATAPLPVLWLGGLDLAALADLAAVPPAQRPAGIAVRSALCNAASPAAAARALRAAVEAWLPPRR